MDVLHTWLVAKRQALAKADLTAKAIDYSLSNWPALSHFLDDGKVPIDNNAAENAVRPLAVGRNYVQSVIMWSRRWRREKLKPRRACGLIMACSHDS